MENSLQNYSQKCRINFALPSIFPYIQHFRLKRLSSCFRLVAGWWLDSKMPEQPRDGLDKGEFNKLSPYRDPERVFRVGGWADTALRSYETRHRCLLPRDYWVSRLIVRYALQSKHTAIAATVANIRKAYWIVGAHDLAKSLKFKFAFAAKCRPRRPVTRLGTTLVFTKTRLAVLYWREWKPELSTLSLPLVVHPWSSSKFSEDYLRLEEYPTL